VKLEVLRNPTNRAAFFAVFDDVASFLAGPSAWVEDVSVVVSTDRRARASRHYLGGFVRQYRLMHPRGSSTVVIPLSSSRTAVMAPWVPSRSRRIGCDLSMSTRLTTYLILFRGINVGGKNKVPMVELRALLTDLGFRNVRTYIQSGNAIVQSELTAETIARKVEEAMPGRFTLDTAVIRVLVLSRAELEAAIDKRPTGFGDQPDTYHSDAIFLMDVDAAEAMPAFSPKEGVDALWPGDGLIYSQRLSAQRTKSRLNRVMSSPLYKSMTIRSWQTTTALMDLVKAVDDGEASIG
jgi:uncharacterized protein (DUF1697 family)